MQRMSEKMGHEKTVDALYYLRARLERLPGTEHLREQTDKAIVQLNDGHEKWQSIRRRTSALNGAIEYQDSIVDQQVMDISRKLLVVVKNERNDPTYLKLFPESPSMRLRPIGTKQQEFFILNVVSRIESDAEYEAYRPQAAILRDELGTLEQLLKEREELQLADEKARTDYRIVKQEVQRTYNMAYPMLQVMFPNKTTLCESCFMRFRQQKHESGEDDE